MILLLPLAAIILVIHAFYWFTKDFFNSRKAGIRVAQALTLITIGSFSYFIFLRESVFFKSNIIKMLNENQLALHHDFKKVSSHNPGFLIANTGFALEIDKEDQSEIIKTIKSSIYFREIPEDYYFDWDQIKNPKVNKVIIDSETATELLREVHIRKNSESIYITIPKNTNKLTYENE